MSTKNCLKRYQKHRKERGRMSKQRDDFYNNIPDGRCKGCTYARSVVAYVINVLIATGIEMMFLKNAKGKKNLVMNILLAWK